MLKRLKIVLLISIIVMASLSSIVLAADDLPDVEGDMTDKEIKETIMLAYASYLKDNSTKKEVKFLINELQKLTEKELVTYYSKNNYKNNIPIPNIILTETDTTLDKKFKIFTLIIQNRNDLKIKLNAGITKIIAIDQGGMQHEAYTYFDSDIPAKLREKMISDNNIYSGAADGFAIAFPYFEKDFKTIYIDSIIYEDNHREEIKIENLY